MDFKLIKYLVISILIFFCGNSFSQVTLVLETGVTITDQNINQIAKTSHEYARSRKSHKLNNDGGVITFFKKQNNDLLYSLSTNSVLHLTNFSARQSLGRWSLVLWPYTYIPDALIENYAFDSTESKESIRDGLANPPRNYDGAGALITNLGCLPEKPLRYGKIFNAAETDLLIIMGGQLIVFSPTYKRTVFAEYYHHDDVYPLPIKDIAWETPATHYGSSLTMEYAAVAIPAIRSYAKLYIDNVDNDLHPDVVVWRKVYRSNLKTEPQGYTLISNTFAHYEQDLSAQATDGATVTGEYLPQNTSESQIQQWLATNNLSWQKGYPNLSECAGQTTQHIPEMIDPLLDDPDVLK